MGDIADDIVKEMGEGQVFDGLGNQTEPKPNPDKPDAPKPDAPKPDAPKPDAPEFNLEAFNKTFETNFEDTETIKKKLTGLEDYEEVRNFYEEYKEAPDKIKDLSEQLESTKSLVDPMSHFASKEEYVRQQIIKKHPEYDPSIVTRAVLTDADKLSPEDAIKMQMLLEDSDIFSNDDEVLGVLEHEFNFSKESGVDEMETQDKVRFLKKAKEARKFLSSLKEGIEVPDAKNIAEDRQKQYDESLSKWKPALKDFENKIDPPKISYENNEGKEAEFVFDFDEDFKKALSTIKEKAIEFAARSGKDPEKADEFAAELADRAKETFIANNLQKISEAFMNHRISEMSEEQIRELHNPLRQRKTTPTQTPDTKQAYQDAEAEVERNLGIR